MYELGCSGVGWILRLQEVLVTSLTRKKEFRRNAIGGSLTVQHNTTLEQHAERPFRDIITPLALHCATFGCPRQLYPLCASSLSGPPEDD